jgi:selenoprotein W-related protein
VTEELLGQHLAHIDRLTLIPGSGGIFNVKVDDTLIYSKKETGRFPEPGEIPQLFIDHLK